MLPELLLDPQDIKHNKLVQIARSILESDGYHIFNDGETAIVSHPGHLNFYITKDHIDIFDQDLEIEKIVKMIASECKKQGIELTINNYQSSNYQNF